MGDKKIYTTCVQIYLFLHPCLPIPHSSAGTAEPPVWHRHPWLLPPIIWWLLVTSGAVLEPAHPLSLSGFVYFNLCCSYNLCFILHFHSLTSQGQHGLPACPTQCGSEASSIAWAFLWVLPSTHSDWKYFSPGNPVLTTKKVLERKPWGSQFILRRQVVLRMGWVLSSLREKKTAWVVTGNSGGWDVLLRLRETIPEVLGVAPHACQCLGYVSTLIEHQNHTECQLSCALSRDRYFVLLCFCLWVFHSMCLGCFFHENQDFFSL